MISSSVLSSLIAIMVVVLTLPLLLLVALCIRYKTKIFPFFAGLATYVFFALELESIILAMILSRGSEGNVVSYTVLSAVMSTLFEVGGMALSYKLLHKAYPKKLDSVNFGAGFAGMEALIVSGTGAFINYSYSYVLNSVGETEFLESLKELEGTDGQALLATIKSLTASNGYAEMLSRIAGMALAVAMSVFVFTAVSKGVYKWLGIAAFFKFVVSIPMALVSYGAITNYWISAAIMLIPAAVAVYMAVNLFKTYDSL